MDNKKDYEELYYFGYFKKLYESWEESTGTVMDIWLNSPYMDRAVDKSVEFKNYIHNFIEETLESRCGPKTGDIDKLIEYIDSLEENIRGLEEKVEALEGKPKSQTPRKKKK